MLDYEYNFFLIIKSTLLATRVEIYFVNQKVLILKFITISFLILNKLCEFTTQPQLIFNTSFKDFRYTKLNRLRFGMMNSLNKPSLHTTQIHY